MIGKITKRTYSWISIRMVPGQIRSLLLVRPYQVNNQVNNLFRFLHFMKQKLELWSEVVHHGRFHGPISV